MEKIIAKQAPAAVGPYSHATVFENTMFLSGQLGIDPATGKLEDTLEKQTMRALNNMESVLKEKNADRRYVLKTTIFVTDIQNFSLVNKIYGEFFGDHHPARSTVQVSALPLAGLIEIEAIATIIK